ncbi:MAG: flap endonuclease-1 [Candidatus Aenigmarchaeota archaeon]|nr:flap endonuclease-1 [Candidatus Aenigmarchaeota archaeon]
MGVQLTQLVKGQPIELADLFDKTIAIDSFNWIYQFLSIIRQMDGTPLQDSRGRVTSHMSGLFYRSLKLMENGIRLVYVFDGAPPKIKAVGEQRKTARQEAMEEWKKALDKGDNIAAKKYAMRSSTITDEIIEGSKRLLEAMGIPVVQAPSEGEAMCAYMCKKGDVYSVGTQDYDALLFGAPRLTKNLSITGKRAGDKVLPELIVLDRLLKEMQLTREQLIAMSIIIGTDYNPGGVPGYGPKKAFERVKEKKTFDKIFADLIWDFPAQPEEIYDFFINPPVCEYQLKWKPINLEKVKKIMCSEHNFSEERIENAVNKLKDSKKPQSSLGRFAKN